jgi:hypothetical protein
LEAGDRQRSEAKAADSITSVHLQFVHQRNALTTGVEDTAWIAGPVWSVPLAPIAKPVMTYIKSRFADHSGTNGACARES